MDINFFILSILKSIFNEIKLFHNKIEEVRANNFTIELHYVTTKDGYILSLFNMPPRTRNSSEQSKPKIMLLNHYLFGSTGQFIAYNNVSAAYFFSEHGYDVWFGNARGTFLSENHTTFQPDSAEYWRFSWHELGVFE